MQLDRRRSDSRRHRHTCISADPSPMLEILTKELLETNKPQYDDITFTFQYI